MPQKGLSQKQWGIGLERNEYVESKKRENEKRRTESTCEMMETFIKPEFF